MEKLKDAAMLLSIANSIGLVGTTAYFYKQIEAVRLDMVKMSQTMTGVLRKLSEMEKGDQHKTEALHALNDQIKRINDQIDDLPSFDSMDNIDLDLTEIIAVLEDNNIQVDRPSLQTYGRGRRSGDRRVPPARRPEIETDDRREVRRTPRQRSELSRTSTRDQSRDSVRDQSRDSTRDTSTRDQRALIPRVEPAPSFDDDSDLIGEVRRQQQPARI